MINNLWMRYLGNLGYTGTIDERRYDWLNDNTTGEAETIDGLWVEFLGQKGYQGQINTMQMQWLGDQGYTGTLNQRFIQFLQGA